MRAPQARRRKRRGRWSIIGGRPLDWANLVAPLAGAFLIFLLSASPANNQQVSNSSSNQQQNLQSISNWLRLSPPSSREASPSAPNNRPAAASGIAVEVSPPPSLFQYQPAASRRPLAQQASSSHTLVATASRSAKLEFPANHHHQTDDELDQFNLFVSNTCERDFMLIRVRTSRPFYGVIHTLNYRRRPRCSLEGDGSVEYQLNISHALDSRDPAHCGVIKLRKQEGGEPGELLSVVLAIRVHRNVELSDDKFLVLNCTNRCRSVDCSSGGASLAIRHHDEQQQPIKQRQLEKEFDSEVATSQDQTSWWTRAAKRAQARNAENQAAAACNVWRFPWLLALLCCLTILLIGSAISNCIICMSLSSRRAPPPDSKPTRMPSDGVEDERERQRRRRQDKYINYDNSEYHRPVDVAYLQGAGRARRGGNTSDGSHQRAKTMTTTTTTPKR